MADALDNIGARQLRDVIERTFKGLRPETKIRLDLDSPSFIASEEIDRLTEQWRRKAEYQGLHGQKIGADRLPICCYNQDADGLYFLLPDPLVAAAMFKEIGVDILRIVNHHTSEGEQKQIIPEKGRSF